MNIDASKIQLEISDEKILISDRMPIKFLDISISLLLTGAFAIFFLGVVGIFYALIFTSGYVLFRYFSWIIWKEIEIDFNTKKLTTSWMLFTKRKRTETLTTKFDSTNLTLKKFEQSGMKRAMIQYQNHTLNDLLLLTHQDDIDLVKQRIFDKPRS